MKTRNLFFVTILLGVVCMLQSCSRTGNDVWEDTKSAGRHVKRGASALGGKQGDSRQIRNRGDFECIDDENFYDGGAFQEGVYQDVYGGGPDGEFIPIDDPANELSMADMVSRPARETPGEPGSSIPGIQAFRDPSTIPQLAGIFQPIYFEYNCSMVKGARNLQAMHGIADFLRTHPNIYMFVEGHTDERGPQAYNLALGARRANAVRNMLIGEGISPDRLFTISYGKERPVVLERHEEGWSRNRRAEFKIYER